MKDVTTLDRLAVGQRAAVTEVSAPEDQRRSGPLAYRQPVQRGDVLQDRKSTRLNSSHR